MAQNHPDKIAIVGATGRIGGYFARALLKAGKHTITTLRRADSKGKYPEGAKIVDVDFDDESSLVKALEGQQVLIITLSVRAPPTLHSTIVKAAVKAGVPYIMPNTWGLYLTDELAKNSQYAANGLKLYQEIQDLGATYIAMGCGFWYEWSLGLGEPWYGFDIKARTVTFYDDGKTVINTSTWDQCARAIVALLSLPLRGAFPALSDWDNRAVLVSSFRVSQRDMLDSLHRVLGTTDADWEISYEQTDLREKRGLKMAAAGDLRGIATSLYARAFMPSSQSDFESRHGTDNEKLGLPKEDLDEATKRTVDMVNDGFSPMTQFS